MPVHYFKIPDRHGSLDAELDSVVDRIESGGEDIVATERFGSVIAIFTVRTRAISSARKPAKKKAAAK